MQIRASSTFGRRGTSCLLAGALSAGLVTLTASPRDGQVFRAAVDLIAVDVQVVDHDGNPIARLGPNAFDVSINGRKRNVVSVDFVRQGSEVSGPLRELQEPNPTVVTPDPDAKSDDGRLFILAVDNGSFDPGTVSAAVEAMDHFIQHLEPEDRIGLYVYPRGPKVDPTRERAKIRAALMQITGDKSSLLSQFNLLPSEIVDITAALSAGIRARMNVDDPRVSASDSKMLAAIIRRECPDDPNCFSSVLSDVAAMAPQLEEQAQSSLGGLDNLLHALSVLPGRKAVVLVSAGVLVSDRSDGRPDVGDVSRVMGQTAARANATVYTVQVQGPSTSSAQSRRPGGVESNRDRQLRANWLDDFSAAAGGQRFYVPVGGGDFAFDRVLRETSAHYLLGVEPEDTDRDGRPRELKVKVAQRGLTVRSRQWVVIPASRGNS